MPMPISRNGVPSASRSSSGTAASNMRSASWVGVGEQRGALLSRKSAVLSFSVTSWPASFSALAAPGDLLGEPPQHRRQLLEVADDPVEGGLGGDALGSCARRRHAGRRSSPRARRQSRPPSAAEAARQLASRPCCCRSAMRADAVARRARACVAWPTPQMSADRLAAPGTAALSAAPITAKPRGLSRSEAILARNLLCEGRSRR